MPSHVGLPHSVLGQIRPKFGVSQSQKRLQDRGFHSSQIKGASFVVAIGRVGVGRGTTCMERGAGGGRYLRSAVHVALIYPS